jgi:hypothetical protein
VWDVPDSIPDFSWIEESVGVRLGNIRSKYLLLFWREDMKGKFLFGCSLIIAGALAFIALTPSVSGQAPKGKSGSEPLITVLNPAISTKMAERVPLCPRTGTLDGKTVYMVDLQWGGPEAAYSVFEEIQAWFAKNMPSVKTEIRRSSGGPFGDDAGLRKEILEKKAAGVIVGIGG